MRDIFPCCARCAASYFLAGATMTGGTMTVEGCGSESLQVRGSREPAYLPSFMPACMPAHLHRCKCGSAASAVTVPGACTQRQVLWVARLDLLSCLPADLPPAPGCLLGYCLPAWLPVWVSACVCCMRSCERLMIQTQTLRFIS